MANLELFRETNPTAYRIIRNSFRNKKVAHTYLFNGGIDTDLEQAPEILIQALISDNDIFAGQPGRLTKTYPDLLVVDGQSKLITKEQISAVREKLQLTALDDKGVKILLIKKVENSNKYALNMLLKIMESPPPATYIIMTASQVHRVLTTIRSRSLEIRLRPISFVKTIEILRKHNLSQQYARVLAFLTRSPERAEDWINRLQFSELYPSVCQILTKTCREPAQSIRLKKLFNSSNQVLLVLILLVIVEDIARAQHGYQLINPDHQDIVNWSLAANFDTQRAFAAVESFLTMVKHNVNQSLNWNSLVLNWEKCYG
ncbi:hypothetical protein [Mycoplasma sp. ATU-Cv-703]|uniref:hypothetical protein n=1 Tax=Mycoplasma sp. ATU-Cv-703 TaxID=2498595 RepID=UPI000FDD8AA1